MKSLPEIEFHNKESSKLGVEILDLDYFKDPVNLPTDHAPDLPHRLKFHIVFFIRGGKPGKHLIDFKHYSYSKGSIMVLGRDQVHSMKDVISHSLGQMLLFTEDFLQEISATYPALATHYNNYGLFHPVCSLSPASFKHIIQLLEIVKSLLDEDVGQLRGEAVRAYIKIILLQIFEYRQVANINLNTNPHFAAFLAFQNLIKQYLNKEHSVQFYANQMHCSPKRLNRIVRGVVRQTTKDYIVSQIVLEAKRHLKSSKLTIAEIGYTLGFNETTNFTKFFKKHAGMLPSQFVKSA